MVNYIKPNEKTSIKQNDKFLSRILFVEKLEINN